MKYLIARSLLATGVSLLCAANAYAEAGVSGSANIAANLAPEPLMLAQPINDDDRFMALRDAALHEDSKAAQLHAAALGKYDVPSYVDYYQLRARLRSASNAEFLQFLKKYEGNAIADRLRNDWLLVLGYRGDWGTFDQQLPLFVVNDDNQVKCYALLSKAQKQQKVAVEARALLNSPKQYGEGCYTLITQLVAQGQFTDGDLWAQMRMAAESSAAPFADSVADLPAVPGHRAMQAPH
ncbi:MAG: hypothetical protein E6Q34_06530 [Burkholderiaceae bacterium]|nr:MAG: hypothetical protein E6Q34_06530 [Burkholderiaceae bacterium]